MTDYSILIPLRVIFASTLFCDKLFYVSDLNVIELHFSVHCRDSDRKRADLRGTPRLLV